LLIHEATFPNEMQEHGHSNIKMAIEFAMKINAKHCYLTHISSRFDTNELEKQIKETIISLNCKINVNAASDLLCFDVHQLLEQ